jgi:hypothetical protein
MVCSLRLAACAEYSDLKAGHKFCSCLKWTFPSPFLETAMSLTTIHLSPATQRWLRNCPITPYVLIYLDYLTACRYADETSEHHLASLAHLGLWMGIHHFHIEELDEALVTQFLDGHLPHCDCPRPIFQTRADISSACGHFLRILRDRGIIPVKRL